MSDRAGFVGWGDNPGHHIAVRDPAGVVQRWIVGQAEDCDVRVNDKYVSGHHCQVVRLADGRFMVCDLGSTNGSYLNGTQIRGWVPIVPGMTLRVGRSEIPWQP